MAPATASATKTKDQNTGDGPFSGTGCLGGNKEKSTAIGLT
jgi:hypothetical protein